MVFSGGSHTHQTTFWKFVGTLKCKKRNQTKQTKKPIPYYYYHSDVVMSENLNTKVIHYLVIHYFPFISFSYYIKTLCKYFVIGSIIMNFTLDIKGGIKLLARRGMLRLKGLKTNALLSSPRPSPFIKCPPGTPPASEEMLPATTHMSLQTVFSIAGSANELRCAQVLVVLFFYNYSLG